MTPNNRARDVEEARFVGARNQSHRTYVAKRKKPKETRINISIFRVFRVKKNNIFFGGGKGGDVTHPDENEETAAVIILTGFPSLSTVTSVVSAKSVARAFFGASTWPENEQETKSSEHCIDWEAPDS